MLCVTFELLVVLLCVCMRFYDLNWGDDIPLLIDNVYFGPPTSGVEPGAGDANRDGVVSAGDYGSVQINFGDTGAPNDMLLLGDANNDGVVSAGDYGSVQVNFGSSYPYSETAATPEPTTMTLIALGGLSLIRRRRK